MPAPNQPPLDAQDDFEASHQRILSTIHVRRIVLPVALGIVALGLMFWFQFDLTEF
jgi:hypothetical protein